MKTYHTYSELEDDLRQMICSGKLTPGQKIPGENKLARQYGICRNSVRKGIGNLIREGMLQRVRGSGTFVIPPAKREGTLLQPDSSRKVILYVSFSSLYPRKIFISKVRLNELFHSLSGVFPAPEYEIKIAHVGTDWKAPEILKKKNAAGVIFDGVVPEKFFNTYLKDLPCVGINGFNRDFDCSWVLEDFAGEKELEVSYLYKHHYRRIAILSDESETPPAATGLQGYKYALEQHGLPFREDWVFYWSRPKFKGELQAENVYRPPDYLPYLRKAFEKDISERPDAVICFDQWRGINTVEALAKLGLKVPQDVGILCRLNPHCQLDLDCYVQNFTGFHCRKEEVFLEAARVLYSEIKSSSAVRNKVIYLRPSFIPGESVLEDNK